MIALETIWAWASGSRAASIVARRRPASEEGSRRRYSRHSTSRRTVRSVRAAEVAPPAMTANGAKTPVAMKRAETTTGSFTILSRSAIGPERKAMPIPRNMMMSETAEM